jgi:serine/threonine-protein kinase
MPVDPQVQLLLEEILESNRTPEDVCQSCPELLPQVRDRLKRVHALEAQFDSLLPTPGFTPTPHAPTDGKLPQVPGYEVQAILGRGGMGVVYKARQSRLNRIVALKMMLAGAYAGPHERARFQREAEAVASLHHCNIVQIYDVGDHDGCPFFTMELLEGGSLAQALAGTPQPARQAAALLITLAEAMHVAHRASIVHRDLKPANILLTEEGSPKVADFGLARHFDIEAGLSLSGARIGTPSYMAPEQVIGEAATIGPATDVYALGTVLYEMLTGRPPFRGETAAETEQQVIAAEPVPPAQLNPKVPRDLETICLKCLQKEPQRRYATALDLADDLKRFRDGRPIQARPVGQGERLWQWVRRKPTEAALVATALTSVALALGGGLWLERQRADQRAEKARQEERASQTAKAALEKAASLGKQGRWREAQSALAQVRGLVEASAPRGLIERLRRAQTDASMVSELEEIPLRIADHGRSDEAGALTNEQLYAEAFRKYGIPLLTLQPADAAFRVRSSSIRESLVSFMHDWLRWVPDENRARLRDVLDRSDDDDWRYAFRKALVANDLKELSALARAPVATSQPPIVIIGLAGAMLGTQYKYEALSVMRDAQQRSPDDFWINYFLGCFWSEEYPQEAVGYLRAAAAIRPTSDAAQSTLGKALLGAGDADGAIAAFRRSLALNSTLPIANDFVWAQAPRGGLEEARAAWEKRLHRDPPDHDSWFGYAPLCLFLGNETAYRWAREALLKRFGDTTDDWIVAERASVSCLLMPSSGNDLRRAVKLVDLAVAAGEKPDQPGNPYLRFAKGLALFRGGRHDAACPLLLEAAETLNDRAGPRLALAMAQFQSGRPIEARKTLAAAVRAYDWKTLRLPKHADQSTLWISHVLRREAESMILPNLPAFLKGEFQPRDNDQRIALLGICQSLGRSRDSARLYADAFAADPGLADTMMSACLERALDNYRWNVDPAPIFDRPCRYLAARCAALAGGASSDDGHALADPERTRWRKQARQWLQADLAIWSKHLNGDSPLLGNLARRMLRQWQSDPDLAGLREPQLLDDLSVKERNECSAFWREVRIALAHGGHQKELAVLDPKPADVRRGPPAILLEQGRAHDAWVAWQSALEADPVQFAAWYGYAELCLYLGKEDNYRSARRDLLEHFGTTSQVFVAERVARACLLMPAARNDLSQALALAKRARVDSPGDEWARPYFSFVHGLAAYREQQFDVAMDLMRGDASHVLGPAPGLVLAMALYRSAQIAEARTALAAAVLAHDWRPKQVLNQDGCIAHALRREAEAMILPNLPAFLDGNYRPENNDERLALLGVCQFTNRTCAAAHLYADAFAADPHLAEDLNAGHRFNAARSAALAGCGIGLDGSKLSVGERKDWRRQTRDWLRADLAACTKLLESKTAGSRELARRTLANWKTDPDLARLREPSAMDTLSTDERNECLQIWEAVDRLLSRAREAR